MKALAALLCLAAPPALADAERCRAFIEAGLKKVEAAPSPKRVRPALEALAACVDLGELATAARKAAKQPRPERAETLGEVSGGDCAVAAMAEPATSAAKACPPPMELAPELIRAVDQGTYLFTRATHAKLKELGALTPRTERVLENLLLAASLEKRAGR